MNGKQARTVRVMLSSGGVSFTDRLDPTHTAMAAVSTMFRFGGTVITAGVTAINAKSKWDKGQGKCSALAGI